MIAKCLTNVDPISRKVYANLEIGKEYEIEELYVESWHTYITLKDFCSEKESYNSVMFEIPCNWDYTRKIKDQEDY